MLEAITSAEFWFGAIVLIAFQIAKFSEVNASDPSVSARFALVPNLRAGDFTSRFAFNSALTAHLLVTFFLYLLLCSLSPKVLEGWANVTGEKKATILSVPYPLYIAAVLVGLQQPPIPALANVGNIQRNLFHAWLGVPKAIVLIAQTFSDQLVMDASKSDLQSIFRKLIGDEWVGDARNFGRIADTIFYRFHLVRINLVTENDIEEVTSGSARELKSVIQQLVYIATIATVRKTGRKGLGSGGLASLLKVSPPKHTIITPGDFVVASLIWLVTMTLLCFAISLLHGVATLIFSHPGYWPAEPIDVIPYLAAQAGPILVALVITLASWSRKPNSQPVIGGWLNKLVDPLNRHGVLLLILIVVLVFYNFAQALYDLANYNGPNTAAYSLKNNAPFIVLHSLIAASTCFIMLSYLEEVLSAKQSLLALLVTTCALSGLYAISRVLTNFQEVKVIEEYGNGMDYVILVVALNAVAAAVGLISATVFVRRIRDANTGSASAAVVATADPVIPVRAPNDADPSSRLRRLTRGFRNIR